MEDNMKDILDKIKKVWKDKIVPVCVNVKEKTVTFLGDNKRYVAVVGLFVCFVLVLVFFAGSDYNAKRIAKQNSIEISGDEYEPAAEFEIDAYPEVNALVESYFNAYVNADFTTLETLAIPISEMEKSYITTMSSFYDEYQNVVCYTKQGLSKDSYIVSACFNIKFAGQEVTAPSMVLFYVQTAEDGSLYINNLYSDFNMMYAEQPLDSNVYTALRKYTTQEDYLALYSEVENAFNDLIREDNTMYQITKRFIPAFRQEWEDNVYYVEQTTEADGTESTEATQTTETTQTSENTQTSEQTQTSENTQTTEQTQTSESESTSEATSEKEETVIKKVKVVGVTGNVNIRKKADADSEDIGDAYNGDVFVKLGEKKDSSGAKWVKIQFNGDKVGYIKKSFTEEVTE